MSQNQSYLMKKPLTFLFLALVFACQPKKEKVTDVPTIELTTIEAKETSTIEQAMQQQGLVAVRDVDSNIMVEMKYSTTDNFMNADVYGDFDKAYLQKKAAEMLKKANESLKKSHPTYVLLIYDAARPRSIQQVLWDTLKVKPGELKTDFVADPKIGSIHNYGSAVDLTVYDKTTKRPLDMGTKYDFFGELAYPKHEKRMLAEGKLSQENIENRLILRNAMKAAGFLPIESEWWHFNALSRNEAKIRYKIVE